MEDNTTTLPQVLEQLEKVCATMRQCSALEQEQGDPMNAAHLTSATMQLEEVAMKVKMCIFEKRQTALW